MIRTMVRASLGANRLVSVFLAGFLLLASALLSSALILTLGVFGSVDRFMEQAKLPHYMQMHSGPVNAERMQRFVDARPEVTDYELIEILNVDNGALAFDGTSLGAEIQQNVFATQSKRMDLLLSTDGTLIHPKPGEIYVPLFYQSTYDLKQGQQVSVRTPDGERIFTIAGVFRDAQMNSTMSSSKRLLISDADYAQLRETPGTSPEYLIDFRLRSPGDAKAFEAAYAKAGLEADGPSLTWGLFRLVNSLNDMVTVLLISLMSFIILLISFLCIRYTLLTTIEEDLREIGVMKAIGVRDKRIRAIYLGKYRWLLGGGCVVGFLLAVAARGAILANVKRQMGAVNHPWLGLLAGLLGAAIVYLVAEGYVRRVLKKLRKISPLNALHGVSGLSRTKQRPRPAIAPATGRAVNRRYALAAIRRDPSRHLTILVVAFLVTLVLLVPFRVGATVGSEKFVTYMGMGDYDLRIDLLNRDDATAVARRI